LKRTSWLVLDNEDIVGVSCYAPLSDSYEFVIATHQIEVKGFWQKNQNVIAK